MSAGIWVLALVGCDAEAVDDGEPIDVVDVQEGEAFTSVDDPVAIVDGVPIPGYVLTGMVQVFSDTGGCNGVLIADDTVLTVATCLCTHNTVGGNVCANRARVVFRDDPYTAGTLRPAIEGDVIPHPNYNPTVLSGQVENDLAVIQLDDSAPAHAEPFLVAEEALPSGSLAIVASATTADGSQPRPREPRQAPTSAGSTTTRAAPASGTPAPQTPRCASVPPASATATTTTTACRGWCASTTRATSSATPPEPTSASKATRAGARAPASTPAPSPTTPAVQTPWRRAYPCPATAPAAVSPASASWGKSGGVAFPTASPSCSRGYAQPSGMISRQRRATASAKVCPTTSS